MKTDLDPIIRVSELRKTFKVSKRARGFLGHLANVFVPMYETRTAVNGVSFEIKRGEAVGLIGSNGAGKSTTMKMLSGILYPDSGSIEVAGFVPYRQRREYVANIGAAFGQKSQLSWDLPKSNTIAKERMEFRHACRRPMDSTRR